MSERVVLPVGDVDVRRLLDPVAVQAPQLSEDRIDDLLLGPVARLYRRGSGGEGQQGGRAMQRREVVPGVPPAALGALLADRVDAVVPELRREPQEDLLERVHLQPAQGAGDGLGQRRLDDEVVRLQHADRHRDDGGVGGEGAVVGRDGDAVR